MGLMKKLTAAIATSSLVVTMVGMGMTGVANAAYTPANGELAGARMQKLGIVQGRGTDGDLQLNAEITRAELATIIVRAFGQEENAKLLQGSTAFPDTAKHWASGNIAMAKALVEKAGGDAIGMPDGTFNPDGKLTPAQSVAFLMKFLGVKRDATKAWPQDYLSAAVTAGLITSDDAAVIAPMLNQNATRGLVFYMFDRAFATYPVETGKTFYTKYVDTVPPVLTVNKVDATTVDDSVTITGTAKDATEVFVGADKATLNADGSFSDKYALTDLKDYSITVKASDLAGNSTTQQVSITRTTGTADTVAATFDTTLKAGSTTVLNIVVKDKAGNVVKTDADVNVDAAVGTFDKATNTLTAAQVPATGKLTITAGTATKTYDVAVVAGDLNKLVVSPATVDLTLGAFQKFTVTGQDAYGNEVAAPANVTWTASKGFMAADGTFAATNDVTGTVTVTATSGSVTGTASATVFGTPSKIVAAAPSALVANGESSTDLVVTVQDANGNVAKNFNGTLTFTNNSAALIDLSSTSATAVNGQAKITVSAKGATTGTAIVSVSGTGLAGTTASITLSAQTATSVKVTTDPATLAADNTSVATLTAVMLDQTGNPMLAAPSGAWTIDFTASDTTVIGATLATGRSFSVVNGQFQATGTFTAKNNLGTSNITAVVKKDGTASSTITANSVSVSTALVGVPYKLAIDTVSDAKATSTTVSETQQKVVVRILDVNGNQVTGVSNTQISDLTLFENDGSHSNIPGAGMAAGLWTGGKATFTVTDVKAETNTYTAKATWSGNTLTAATATGNFVPGAASALTLSASPNTIAATGTATSTLTAKITDGVGNYVTDGTYNVTFTRTAGGNAIANWADQTVATVNGVASVVVTGTTNVAQDSFKAYVVYSGSTKTYSDGGAAKTIDTVILGAPNELVIVNPTDVNAGAEATVDVNVRDSAHNVVSYDNQTVVTLTATDSDGNVTTYSATAANGVAEFTFTLNTADTYTLKATATGLKGATGDAGANGTQDIAISPASAAGLKVTSNVSTLGADGTSVAKVTVQKVDAYNNVLTGNTDFTGVTLTSGTSGIGSLQNALDVSSGTLAATNSVYQIFKASTTPGSTVLTAKASGLADGTLTLNTNVIGAPAKLSVTVDAAQKISLDGITPVQKITVTVLDANGNRVTNTTATVKLVPNSANVQVYNDSAATQVYTTTKTLAASDAGSISWYAVNAKAEDVTYTASIPADANVANADVVGTFTPGDASAVGLTASVPSVLGDGSNVNVITIKVKDAKGNDVTNVNGTAKISIPTTAGAGSTHAFIQGAASDGTYTATIVNGQAVVIVQTRYVTSTLDIDFHVEFTKDGASSTTATADVSNLFTVTGN